MPEPCLPPLFTGCCSFCFIVTHALTPKAKCDRAGKQPAAFKSPMLHSCISLSGPGAGERMEQEERDLEEDEEDRD